MVNIPFLILYMQYTCYNTINIPPIAHVAIPISPVFFTDHTALYAEVAANKTSVYSQIQAKSKF